MSTPQPFPGQQGPGQQGPQFSQQFPDAQPAAKPKKPLFKRWWFWALAVVLVIGIGSAMSQGGSNRTAQAGQQTAGAAASESRSTQAAPKEKLTLDDGWTLDKSSKVAVYVNGYVTNNTDKAVTNYVQITFDALDAKGANLGTCFANTNTIDAGGKWKFKAICAISADEVAQVRFKEITGF